MNYGEFRARVLRALGDPGGDQYDAALVLDATRAGLQAVLPWIYDLGLFTLAGDGFETSFALDPAVYKVEAVKDENGYILPPANLRLGSYLGSDLSQNAWIEYPKGSLTFLTAPLGGQTVYAQVYWDEPANDSDDTFVIPVPPSALTGLAYFAISECMSPKLVSAANIRQYSTKPDMGTPEHNPLARAQEHFRKLFLDEMSKQPQRDNLY